MVGRQDPGVRSAFSRRTATTSPKRQRARNSGLVTALRLLGKPEGGQIIIHTLGHSLDHFGSFSFSTWEPLLRRLENASRDLLLEDTNQRILERYTRKATAATARTVGEAPNAAAINNLETSIHKISFPSGFGPQFFTGMNDTVHFSGVGLTEPPK
jgi:hypothetical protein